MPDTENTKSRARQPLTTKQKVIVSIVGLLIAIIVSLSAAIMIIAQKYNTRFFPNTYVNEMEVSDLTPDDVKSLMQARVGNYSITVQSRDREDESILGKDIDLKYTFDDTLDKTVADQNSYMWFTHLFNDTKYSLTTMCAVDDNKFIQTADRLSCFNEDTASTPSNATISGYDDGSYHVVDAIPGNFIADKAEVENYIKDAILKLNSEVDIDYEGNTFYLLPAIEADDEKLNLAVDNLNKAISAYIKYTGTDEVLDGSIFNSWLGLDDNLQITIDNTAIEEYVKGLAEKLDTAYKPKQLLTSYGKTVTITGGSYGWKIDQAKEIEDITTTLQSGSQVEREPEYLRKAASHDGNDYGNTYVEINLTAQHLYFYKDGSLVIESDFVSGNTSKGRGTPGGAYAVAYKQRNATLKGQGYSTPVSYWMPFNNGIGLHDANWRSSFGGTIYKTNGSHGCINLPASVAKTIYNNIDAGCPVLCYFLDGSGNATTSKPAATTTQETTSVIAETVVETTPAPSETVPPASETRPEDYGPGMVTPDTSPASPDEAPSPSTEGVTGVEGGPGV